jgi:hypothetical protein
MSIFRSPLLSTSSGASPTAGFAPSTTTIARDGQRRCGVVPAAMTIGISVAVSCQVLVRLLV